MAWDGDTYREAVVKYLVNHKVFIRGKWNYQFGIFRGTTLIFIYEMFRKYGLIPEKILAFDSFDGLPDETPGVQKNPVWQRREFSAKYVFGTDSTREIVEKIENQLPDRDIPIQWFEGFFSDVLNDMWMKSVRPKPAFWVDLDVDLYRSTIDVLDFMFKHKLIIPGTILSADDWGGTEEYMGGESLAFKEMSEKYAVVLEEIHSYTNLPHVQKAFIVTSIG